MKKNSETPTINASSMADIAFLLLIFFLVTTTIDQDNGILVKLPQWNPDIEFVPHNERNVLEILINKNDELLIDGQPGRISKLKFEAIQFLDNNGNMDCDYCNGKNSPKSSDHPTKAIISLLSDRATHYEQYIQVYNELVAAYSELRNRSAIKIYKQPYEQLAAIHQKEIRTLYPKLLSEADISLD